MRIALVTDQYLPLVSGLVDSIEVLASQLIQQGHEVRIYAPAMPGSVPEPRIFHFPTWILPGSGGAIQITLPRGAMRDMRRFKPDVVHTHLCGIAGLFGWFAARRLKVPFIGTDHTFPADYLHYAHLDFWPFPWIVKKFSAWYYNRCDFVTTPSRELLEELTDYGLYKPAKIVSNHIPSDLFRPLQAKEELRKKWNIGDKAVLLFGRIAEEKNLDVALDAFEKLSTVSTAQLVIVGDGVYRTELE